MISSLNAETINTQTKGIRTYISAATVVKVCRDGSKILQTPDGKFWIYQGWNIFQTDFYIAVKDQNICE